MNRAPILPIIRNISCALSLLLLVGCAQLTTGGDADSNHYNDPYTQSDFDELLTFGANMAKIPPASRAETCRTLLKRQKNSPGTGVQLHLMIGRLLSDTCGDIPKILDGIRSIPPGTMPDNRMQKLVAIDTEALQQLQTLSKKISSLERKQKTVQSVLESKDATGTKETTGSKKNETRLLREKLEAIRSMEKHLDESGDVN